MLGAKYHQPGDKSAPATRRVHENDLSINSYKDAFAIDEEHHHLLDSEVQLKKTIDIVKPLVSIFLSNGKNRQNETRMTILNKGQLKIGRIRRNDPIDNSILLASSSNNYGGYYGVTKYCYSKINWYIGLGEGFIMLAIVLLTGIFLYLTSSSSSTTTSTTTSSTTTTTTTTTPSTTTMKGMGRKKRNNYDYDDEYETVTQATINRKISNTETN